MNLAGMMGITIPANENIYNIILLLDQISALLGFIFLGVVVILAVITDLYKSTSNPFPRHFEKSVESTLDVLFVMFPTIMILYILVPSLGYIFNTEMQVETVFTLNVIAHQWYWSYEYYFILANDSLLLNNRSVLLNKFEFDSLIIMDANNNRLLEVDCRVIIPVYTNIAVNITSQDVIHSWAVPQLGIKVDAIPGRLMSTLLISNIESIYYGQCSELCGINHAFMPICIQVCDNDSYMAWINWNISNNISKTILNSVFVDIVK